MNSLPSIPIRPDLMARITARRQQTALVLARMATRFPKLRIHVLTVMADK